MDRERLVVVTIAHRFYDWSGGAPDGLGGRCSPRLLLVRRELADRWPFFVNLGCFGKRPIRGSTTVPSTHSWGAALDLGYPPDEDPVIRDHVAGFLVAWSEELGLDLIGDYRRCRIWRAGRTPDMSDACTVWWKAQRPSSVTGMGQPWANHLHLEVHPSRWGDTSPLGIT